MLIPIDKEMIARHGSRTMLTMLKNTAPATLVMLAVAVIATVISQHQGNMHNHV